MKLPERMAGEWASTGADLYALCGLLHAVLRSFLRQGLHKWLLIVLAWLSVVLPAPAHAEPIDIAQSLVNYAVRAELDILHDPEGTLTLAEMLGSVSPSRFSPATRLHFPRCDCALWTRFQLNNPTPQTRQILLMNPWPYVNTIDLYAVKADGSHEHHLLGSHRRHLQGRILHRYEVQPLLVGPGETITLFTRHASANAINVGVNLFSPEHLMDFLLRDAQVWGIFTGLVFALLIYNSFVGVSLQQKSFLIYVVHAAVLYVFTIFLMGESIVAWLKPLLGNWGEHLPLVSSATAAHVSRVLTCGVMITATGFAMAYFEVKTTLPKIYRLFNGFILLAALFIVAELLSIVFAPFALAAALLLYLLPVFLFGWLLFAVYAAWKKMPGSLLYLAGTGSFVLLALLQDAHWLGLDVNVPEAVGAYGIPIGFMLELLFLGLALGVKVRHIKKAHDQAQMLLLEQARFSSLGQLVSGVVHQLKRPVIYAGTQLMKLEALAERPASDWPAALPRQLAEMRKTIDFMDQTILNLYQFYALDTSRKRFSPAEQIEQALEIITPMTTGSALRIEKKLLPEVTINGFPNAFAHAVLIVLENAAQALKEREVAAPCIHLVMAVDHQKLIINISDNAGGIASQPPERIFDGNYSLRLKSGMGIGLMLAKRIIEEKFAGCLMARNEDGGALFMIEIGID